VEIAPSDAGGGKGCPLDGSQRSKNRHALRVLSCKGISGMQHQISKLGDRILKMGFAGELIGVLLWKER
jgi:hypothetical protein